jgi:hypothetical protein
MRIEVEHEKKFEDFYRAIQQQLESIKAHGSDARDLGLSHPSLREALGHNSSPGLPVAIERVECLSRYKPKCDAELLVIIPDDGKEYLWRYDEEVLPRTTIDRMREQFTVF